jgi:hypothetical protein
MARKVNSIKKYIILFAILIIIVSFILFIFNYSKKGIKKDEETCSIDNLRGKCDKGRYCSRVGECKPCPTDFPLLTNTEFFIELCYKKDATLVCLGPLDGGFFAQPDGSKGTIRQAGKFMIKELGSTITDKVKKPIITQGDNAKKYVLVIIKAGKLSYLGSSCNSTCVDGRTGGTCGCCCTYKCNGVDNQFNDNAPGTVTHVKQAKGSSACVDNPNNCFVSQHINFYKTDMDKKLNQPAFNRNLSFLQEDCQACSLNDPFGGGCIGCTPDNSKGCAVEFGGTPYFRLIKPACEGDGQCSGEEICINGNCKIIGC